MNNITQTRQRILICAVDLFAAKGYVETSVRDITTAVGIKPASLYNHFSSKEDILVYMLNDYINKTRIMVNNPELPFMLQKNSTAEGILDCMQLNFSVLTDEYYSKVLHVVYQEQHRNENVRNLVVQVITEIEEYVERIFGELKKLNVIRHDADSDFWGKTASSLLYALPSRSMLGIGQDAPGFTGMNLLQLLCYVFGMVLKIYSVTDS
jgi:AcrR family transcriptional regulator